MRTVYEQAFSQSGSENMTFQPAVFCFCERAQYSEGSFLFGIYFNFYFVSYTRVKQGEPFPSPFFRNFQCMMVYEHDS